MASTTSTNLLCKGSVPVGGRIVRLANQVSIQRAVKSPKELKPLKCRILSAGSAQISLGTTASKMGGYVRVGLEDSMFISRGEVAENNTHLVSKVRWIVEDLGFQVSTPKEADPAP